MDAVVIRGIIAAPFSALPSVTSPMSTPEVQEQTAESADSATAPEVAAAPAPPEPWTPERVLEWNRYYDLYVCAGVVLLVFLAACHKIIGPSIWTSLQVGRMISEHGPVKADPFSFSMYGQPWVNISWLFALLMSQVYGLAAKFAGAAMSAEQVGAITLVSINATVRALTALVLFSIRRPGPGLWWVAVCAALALGATILPGGAVPFAPSLGGVAGPAEVDPSTWGTLFLAVELAILYRAFNHGAGRMFYGLVPLFLLWANFDDSFIYGLVVLAVGVAGAVVDGFKTQAKDAPRLSPAKGFGVLAACALVCLVNPWIASIYPAALAPYLGLVQKAKAPLTLDQLSIFGSESQRYFNRIHVQDQETGTAYRLYIVYYVMLVGAGLLSFVLNWRRFSLARFLMYLFAALMWAALWVTRDGFAIVLAVTLAINGQEWYQDAYGVQGRIGTGWSFWSVGGRLVTLAAIFVLIGKGLTGVGATGTEPVFGFGVNPDDFAFEAADYLRSTKVPGNVLNLTLAHGDAIIWRAYPSNSQRKSFIDSRSHLFTPALRVELQTLRRGFHDKSPELWRPILDRYRVQTVMVSATSEGNAAKGLVESPDWIPFYDDGQVLMFGRADAQGDDLAYFKEHRLDAKQIAYHRDSPVPSPTRAPNPVSFIDEWFPNRSQVSTQPHVVAADHWLRLWDMNGSTGEPDLAHCLIAIREARTAIAHNPDDPMAWRLLDQAYKSLMNQELNILIKRAPVLPTSYRNFRFRQRATVLNYTIQSTPPPRTSEAREELAKLNAELADLYQSVGYYDLEFDRLQKARALYEKAHSEMPPERETRFSQLEEAIDQLNTQLDKLDEEKYGPAQRAEFLIEQGAPGMAINILKEANDSGVPMAQVKPRLLDLYCQIGEPDEALLLFNTVDDPTLMTGPGTATYRQGMANFLIGGYEVAASLWFSRSLPQLRASETMEVLNAARSLLRGDPRGATNTFQGVPSKIGTQAMWEYELGLCLLESGIPSQAAAHFEAALRLSPDLPIRPLLEYYLEMLGKPFDPKAAPTADAERSDTKPAEPDRPAVVPSVAPDADKAAAASPKDTDTPKEKDTPKR